MYVNKRFGQLFIQGFYRSKRGRSRDIFIVYQDGFQDIVFKTTGKEPVNSFHSEMINIIGQTKTWFSKPREVSNNWFFKTMGMD